MGYSTYFKGSFKIEPALKPEHLAYLKAFADNRRIAWKEEKVALIPDPLRAAVNLPVGPQGAYFAGNGWNYDAKRDYHIDFNRPPIGQPSLHCQWISNKKGTALEWDRVEKFYNYIDWLSYLVHNFFEPWGYRLYGKVSWRGQDTKDTGVINMVANHIEVISEGRH